MASRSEQSDLLTVDETIQVLRLGRTRVNEMLRSGELPSYKTGRRWIIRRRDLEAWLEQQKWEPSRG